MDLPHESLWPFAMTVGLTLFFYGALMRIAAFAVVGAAASIVCFMGWIWPRGQTQEM